MRKMLLLLLLASAATTPALAQRGHRGDSDNRRPESSQNDDSDNNESARAARQQAREEARAQRSEPEEASGGRERGFAVRANPDGAGGNSSVEARQHIQIQQQVASDQGGGDDSPRERRHASSGPKIVHPDAVSGGDSGVAVRTFDGNRSRERARQRQIQQDAAIGQTGGTLRQSDRATPNVMRVRNRTPLVSETPRQGTQPPLRAERHRRDRPNWSTGWRHNNRYDWSNWRKRHRSLFRLGFYFDPFGWNYRPYSIGWRLWPSYYNSRYWLSDPWQYRLPYAPPGYRWIRYYNDAILVDTWNGSVVDVIYNFFW